MFVVLLLFVSFLCSANGGSECSGANQRDFGHLLATKTPYRFVKNVYDEEIYYPDCKPIRFWSIVRHGTRNPSRKVIRRFKERLLEIRDKIVNSTTEHQLCQDDLEKFKKWAFHLEESQEKMLQYEGVDELVELAERMQNRFPSLFPDIYDSTFYKFKFTKTERTERSAKSFATGLFGRNNINGIQYPEAEHKDPILRFYKRCEKWKVDVDKNADALKEVKLFAQSDTVRKSVDVIKEKTGIEDITVADAHLMYTMCAFETAWTKHEISPWCLLFNQKSLLNFQFLEDLEYYWVDGYGYEITTKQACPTVKDMIYHLEPSSKEPNTTVYFTHSGTMLKMLGHLGLYRDSFVLTHKDFKKDRKWRVSKIDAFASNLSFITFQCASGTKVLTMHQEQIVQLPGCPKKGLCDLEVFKQNYKDSLENCQFDEFCKIEKTATSELNK